MEEAVSPSPEHLEAACPPRRRRVTPGFHNILGADGKPARVDGHGRLLNGIRVVGTVR